MSPAECKEHAAQCRRMAEGELNLRVQAILTDMARTWDRLAIEAEISQRSEPSLRVIFHCLQATAEVCESSSELAFTRSPLIETLPLPRRD